MKKVEKMAQDDPDLETRGPMPAPVAKIKDFYRFQCWYLTPFVTRYLPKISALRADFPWNDDVIEVIDVDAVNLM